MSTVLLGRSLRHRYNGHVGAAFSFRCELNLSIDEREQGVIFAGADVTAGVPFGAALARKDIAGDDGFAAEQLQAKALAVRVARDTLRGAGSCACLSRAAIMEKARTNRASPRHQT